MRVNRARLGLAVLMLPMFRNRPFTAVLVALVFAGIAMAGTGLLVTQYLQGVLGFSPVASAVLFAPMGLGVATAGTMAAPGPGPAGGQTTAIAGGLAGSALGSLLLAVAVAAAGAYRRRARNCCTPRGRRSPPACTSPASSPRSSSPGWSC